MALGLVKVTLGKKNNVQAFMNYVSKYNKAYDTIEEFEMRLNNFNKVEEQIRNHQERNDVSHTLAHNQFSDWTDAEF